MTRDEQGDRPSTQPPSIVPGAVERGDGTHIFFDGRVIKESWVEDITYHKRSSGVVVTRPFYFVSLEDVLPGKEGNPCLHIADDSTLGFGPVVYALDTRHIPNWAEFHSLLTPGRWLTFRPHFEVYDFDGSKSQPIHATVRWVLGLFEADKVTPVLSPDRRYVWDKYGRGEVFNRFTQIWSCGGAEEKDDDSRER